MDKIKKIGDIKNIISDKYSEGVTPYELNCEQPPCVYSVGSDRNNTSTLVENFKPNGVDLVTYNNELAISEDFSPYENLEEETINDIFSLLTVR